jgi:Zn-dependent metalloprotease
MIEPDNLRRPVDSQDRFPELARARTEWDKRTGRLIKVRGLLTDKDFAPPEEIASRLLQRYSVLLGKETGSVLDDVRVVEVIQTLEGYEVRFQQFAGPLPVYRGQVSVYVTKQGQVFGLTNGYRPVVEPAAAPRAFGQAIDAAEACQIALRALGGEQRSRQAPQAERVIYPTEMEGRPAWRVSAPLRSPAQTWVVLVDSETGEVLEKTPVLARKTK